MSFTIRYRLFGSVSFVCLFCIIAARASESIPNTLQVLRATISRDTLSITFSRPVILPAQATEFFGFKRGSQAFRSKLIQLGSKTQDARTAAVFSFSTDSDYRGLLPLVGDSLWILPEAFQLLHSSESIHISPEKTALQQSNAGVYIEVLPSDSITYGDASLDYLYRQKTFAIAPSETTVPVKGAENLLHIGPREWSIMANVNAKPIIIISNRPFTANIQIFNHFGKFVNATLFQVDESMLTNPNNKGSEFLLFWNNHSSTGELVANGVYIYRIGIRYQAYEDAPAEEKRIVLRQGYVRGL